MSACSPDEGRAVSVREPVGAHPATATARTTNRQNAFKGIQKPSFKIATAKMHSKAFKKRDNKNQYIELECSLAAWRFNRFSL
jgi:hypothetical protein